MGPNLHLDATNETSNSWTLTDSKLLQRMLVYFQHKIRVIGHFVYIFHEKSTDEAFSFSNLQAVSSIYIKYLPKPFTTILLIPSNTVAL